MLSIGAADVRTCDGLHRREWLRVGGLGAAGLMLPGLLAAERRAAAVERASSAAAPGFGRARCCILCFLFGAPAHQDIWDPKPEAPADCRGEFAPIASSVPGVLLGEHVPQVAAIVDRLAIVRSVSHPDNTHTVAMHYMLTGHRHAEPDTNPQNQPTDFPTFGAVVQRVAAAAGDLPAGISLNAPANQVSANNHIFPGFFAGFLGSGYDPLFVSQDPSRDDFRPLPAPAESAPRFAGRRRLLDDVDAARADLESIAAVRSFDADCQRAFRLVASGTARDAFRLAAESDALRERYGRSPFGQGCLLARRLVEAGVRLVTVNWARDDAFWDTHSDNFRLLRDGLLPPFDRAFSALLLDLEGRGLLDETLVVCLGEFGRTPKINAAAGRDHWAACNSVVLAGGGVRGGAVLGASDRMAAYPATAPVSPTDLAATIYHALGIDPATELRDPLGRPWPLAPGRPLVELFG